MKRSIEFIEKMVCENEYVEAERLHTSDRSEPYNTARQMIMVLAVEGGYTFKEAGAYFGRGHSTVISARRSIYNRIETEKPFSAKYGHYRSLLVKDEISSIEFLALELARLKTETMALLEQLNQIAINSRNELNMENEDQICNAEIAFGDDYGDNSCTFHCKLPYGHAGEHEEIGDMYGQKYKLKWVDGE